jgi:hypothetical protein
MSFTVDTATGNRLDAEVTGEAWLIELDFTGGTQRVALWSSNVTVGGNTYTALPALQIPEMAGSEDAAPAQITLRLPMASATWTALAIGNVESYRGKKARIYYQAMGENFQPEGNKVLRWMGQMEPVRISRETPALSGGARVGWIELPLSRVGMARARTEEGLRRTHQQQQALYPGDLGLEQTTTLINQPTDWLSIKFQAAGF